MKTKQFRTSKGLFVITDEKYCLKEENGIRIAYFNGVKQFEHTKFIHFPRITEQQASEIVDKVMNEQHFQNYNYKCVTDRWVKSARESLKSLIESLGIHLYKNPIEIFTFDEDYIKHIETEANTFYNPYIFKIVEY